MVVKEIRPYEISLWTLQDSFITVLKPINLNNRGQLKTPKMLIKDDGTQELSFSVPMYYYDNGVKVENPIWFDVKEGALLVNLRKLKVIFNKGVKGQEEVFEFIINKVTETHTEGQLYCDVAASGLAFQELGKIGYKISLNKDIFLNEYDEWFVSDDPNKGEEPLMTLQYWCDKVFKNSKWNYSIEMDWSYYDGITESLSNEEREARGLRRTDKIYEEEYISSWEVENADALNPYNGKLVPTELVDFKEKARIVEIEKNNIYNITQTIAETFGVYCKYKYSYDENYHIIGKHCIFYNNFLDEKSGKIDINYPYDSSSIERELDSTDVITKMFVVPIEDETSASGLITIADVSANRSLEDYILNFDYLYSIGTITKEQYESIEDYERTMFLINSSITPIASQIAKLQNDLVEYEAQKTIAAEAQNLAKEQMDQSLALLNSITSGTNYLYKNVDNPYRGVLLKTDNSTYYVKVSQEGVYGDDSEKKYGYPIKAGGETAYGIKIFYNKKVDGSLPAITEYTGNFNVDYDEFGNVTAISNLTLMDDAVSAIYYLTFAYLPQLQYQNVYDTFAAQLAENKQKEEEATKKIDEINDTLQKLQDEYDRLLKEKEYYISEFENMMGPALKEGSWQSDSYTDYGSKYKEEITIGMPTTSKNLGFIWDAKPFEEEQLNYYEVLEPTGLNKKYYPCIDLSGKLDKIKNNLNDLSYIYNHNRLEGIFESMTINSELQFGFLKRDNIVKPILLLTDKMFELDANGRAGFIGTIITNVSTAGEIETNLTELIPNSDINWIDVKDIDVFVYPRIRVNTMALKTSEDELSLKYNSELLRKFYDYYVLSRDENYFITLKNEFVLRDALINKTFEISYAISNASLALYLDALEVSKTNAFPQVSYTVKVSGMNDKFIREAYNKLNKIVNINDSELKFENVQGYISELDLDLDMPWEDEIVIQNYKTKFEDLFSTIVASTEQMKAKAYSYDIAAGAFTSSGTLNQAAIQNTLNQVDLTYAFNNGNLTIDEVNGIWATSDSGVVAMRGGGIFCATQQDSYGNWLWNTGITPSGINASLLKAGQIDTNLIKIYAGDNLRFQMNADGLFAYESGELGEANLNKYVVHNSDGLFLKDLGITTNPQNDPNYQSRVEISWDGLILRNSQGERIFEADEETGDLKITGTITANEGHVGPWLIGKYGLTNENGTAGLIADTERNEDGTPVKEPYDMFWVQGQDKDGGYKFLVESDGTLYANNVILNGYISANSYFGNTSGQELSKQIKNISISILEGTTFIFNNRNYDGNLVVEPQYLRFKINTNVLSDDELARLEDKSDKNSYKFYYSLDENTWTSLEPQPDSEFIFQPEYLTFRIKSDIMYKGDITIPKNSLFIKIEKEGKLRQVNSETGETTYTNHLYSTVIQLNSEKHGVGKLISQIEPQSYSFIQDTEAGVEYEPSKTFNVTLIGFTNSEIQNGKWLINGEEIAPDGPVVQTTATSSSITINYDYVPEGGSILLTFKMDTAIREANCFRLRNGADGKDGIRVVLRSSSGSILTSGDTTSELFVEVYYGTQLMNSADSATKYYYVWKKDDTVLPTLMDSAGNSYNNQTDEFFSLSRIRVKIEDFGTKANYSCYVFTDLNEAKEYYETGV